MSRAALFYFVILSLISPMFVEGKGKEATNRGGKLQATDVHGAQRYCPLGQPPGWLGDMITKPAVAYPDWGAEHHEQGTGAFRMMIEPKTGKVEKVMVVKSTGFRDLDDAAISALGRWRWKPDTWKQADVEINFEIPKGGVPRAGLPGYESSSGARKAPGYQ